MSYYVTVPLVVAKLDHGGYAHLYEGAPLPDNMDADQLKMLVADGAVSERGDSSEPPADEPPVGDPSNPEAPKGNASREEWAAYAASKGAPVEETKPVEEGGLKQTELREKYGN